MTDKVCIKCGCKKPVEAFYPHYDHGVIRYRNVCRVCYNAARRKVSTGNPAEFTPDVKDLVTAYLNLIHWKPENLRSISIEKYNKHFNLSVSDREFTDIEDAAGERLEELGYYSPQSIELPADGSYLVVGDTFGTHTPEEIFRLMRKVVRREKVQRVIVLGHNLDDENIVSNLLADFGVPVTVVAVRDELKDLYAQRGYGYDIVQDHVTIGNITLRNQEHITPYTKTALAHLDPLLYPGRMIVNCTRQELSVRPSPGMPRNFIASPGALADPHVVTTINRLILSNGEHISLRPTNKDSYHKHRKNETDKLLWERGYILIRNGEVIQRRIFCRHIEDNLVAETVAGNAVIDQLGNDVPALRILVLSDLHMPRANTQCLDRVLQENPPLYQAVFNGDVFDCRSFNPHSTYEASTSELHTELACSERILKMIAADIHKCSGTKPSTVFLWGNHEDFVKRFTRQYPQFAKFFTGVFNKILAKYGKVASSDHQHWMQLTSNTVIHHGSADIFGTGGNNLEKTARTFGTQAVIGHTHSPAIRFGVYRTGCLCELDQGYNNAGMSNWAYGVAMIYATTDYDFIELRNDL